MTRLIIFDFDGTLGDTRRTIVTTLQQTMQALGLPVRDEDTCASTIGLKLGDCFRKMYPELDDIRINECADTYRRIFEDNRKIYTPELFPGVAETLAELKRKGLLMSIASSRSSRSLNELTSGLGIADCMSFIIGSDQVDKGKPDPEPVLKTLAALGVKAEDTLVVGDMPVDIQMGKAAGARTCAVTWGNATREELLEAGADCIIDEMSELPNTFIKFTEDIVRKELSGQK